MNLRCVLFLLVVPLAAQEIKLPVSLDRLASKASETVDVTLDANLLQLATKFIGDSRDDVKVKKLVSGLKGIYVKSFEFDKTGEYDQADVEAVRSQVKGPGWSRIVGVVSRKKGENAEIYVKSEGGKIAGLVILATEPKELTIVNIVGAIDPDQLSELGGHFGIPSVKTETKKDEE